ncbi:hypothetical protein AVEN_86102-1 [Araneus ventricosus]|uniref:YitH/HolE acetyltransferase (GNAT) domain-containing protein n=1 Tax=Araneus ventricosus TaxID=182803 RepID=A0A4Y2KIK1_ARAVE|nr:hypothetical protein AVEN_86102-1 [Araneus ventricosus]
MSGYQAAGREFYPALCSYFVPAIICNASLLQVRPMVTSKLALTCCKLVSHLHSCRIKFALTKECHDHAGDGNIGVNCSIAKIGLFKRRSIKILETDWKSLEFEVYYQVNPNVLSDQLPAGVEILPYQPSYLEAVLTYDRSLIGYERKSIIEASCNEKDGSQTLVAMKDGRCVGFGSIKLTILGLGRVSPLYADDASVAEAMVKRLIPTLPEAKGFTIVTISSNILGNMMLEKFQIPVHDNIYRLYKKEKVKVDTNKVFAHFDIDFSPF